MQKTRGQGPILKLVSESQTGTDWLFTMSQFKFKNQDLMGPGQTNKVSLSLAVPGIGLPEETFIKFSQIVEKLNSKLLCV